MRIFKSVISRFHEEGGGGMERRRGRRGSLVCRAELWERNGCKYGRLPCLGGGGPRGRRTSWGEEEEGRRR